MGDGTSVHAPQHHGEIILVDGDRAHRTLMALRLQRAGFACHSAGSAVAAMELINHVSHLRAVVLDFDSAKADNSLLIRTIQARFAGAVLVGTSTASRGREFERLGVPHFIQKPWHEEDLDRLLCK